MLKKLILIFGIFFGQSLYAWQPQQPINIVVGFPPGGSTDLIARIIADGFNSRGIKTTVINKPGAGSAIAVASVMQSPPDGYTVMLTGTSFLFNNLIGTPGIQYNLFNDFIHLNAIGIVENHIYANTNNVSGDLKYIIEDIKSNRKQYTWGITNPGAEFTVRLLQDKIKKPITIVRYNGSVPASKDLIGGHIDIVVDSGSGIFSRLIGKEPVKFIGTLNQKNSDSRDSLDQYVPGVITRSWFGLSLPAGINKDVEKFYRQLLASVLEDTRIKARLYVLGLNVGNGIELSELIRSDYNKFKHLNAITTQ